MPVNGGGLGIEIVHNRDLKRVVLKRTNAGALLCMPRGLRTRIPGAVLCIPGMNH